MTFSLNCAPKSQAKFQSSTLLLQHTLLQVMSKVSENSMAGFQICIRIIAFLTTLTAFSVGFGL